jgi:acyl-CoA thioesterase YciA
MWAYTDEESEFLSSRQPNAAAANTALAAAEEPRGELASRTLAMPANANPSGDIFGGWIMSLMDSAAAMTATKLAGGRVVTAAVSNITFFQPVKIGDSVCCYTDVIRTGNTSLTLHAEVWVLRQGQGERTKVTDAEFTFVAVNDNGRPRPVESEPAGADVHPTPW